MKNYLMKIVFVFTLGFVSFNCFGQTTKKLTEEEIMNSWIGSSKANIIMSWGPPRAGITSDGSGGEILMYEEYRTISMPGPRLSSGGQLPRLERTMTYYQYVYCRSDGTIYHIKYGKK